MHGHVDILAEIAIAIIAATLCAFLAKWLRQPLILAYIVAGVLIGPVQGFGFLAKAEDIETIAELGLILLLFMIGLEIDLKKLKTAGKAVAITGAAQFVICVVLGLLFVPLVGFGFGAGTPGGEFAPVYLAVAAALSSTMIVVKLLYDKFELDTLAGRITLGILVFQDIWAILFLALQPNLNNPAPAVLLLALAKGAGLVVFALLVSRFALPVIFRSIAKLPELMLIGALAWCFVMFMLAAWMGLSREMGALIAGISISTFPYNLDVIAKVISLRDFFITLFFVALGAKIPRPTTDVIIAAVAISGFLVVSRFLSITPILYWLKNGNRASIIPAINLSQISEFALVIGALGVGLGHIDEHTLAVIVFVLVITSVGSTYAIQYNYEIFNRLDPLLRKLGMRDMSEQTIRMPRAPHDVVFVGFARYASSLLHELLEKEPRLADRIAVIDYNPQVKQELDRRGITAIYGDISHADTLHHAEIHEAKVVVSTIPDAMLKGTSNERLLRSLKGLAPEADVIVTAEYFHSARELYAQGAAFVFIPRLMGARELRDIVLAALEDRLHEYREVAHEQVNGRAEVLP